MPVRPRLREKLTYSNVVSTLCLFLLLGGGAYAAKQLPKNSVGSRQIRKNAVRTGDLARNAVKVGKLAKEAVKAGKLAKNAVPTNRLRNNAVTGGKVNEATLGTVPSANVANSANGLAPPEAAHLIGTPGEPAFEAGSADAREEGQHTRPVGFYKDHEGIVHLQGTAKVPGEGGPVFTLPPGYRPGSGFTDVFQREEGVFVAVFGPNRSFEGEDVSAKVYSLGTFALLDGITFRAES